MGLNSHGILVLVEVGEEVTIVTPYITTEEFNSIGTTELVQSQLEMGKNLTSNCIPIHEAKKEDLLIQDYMYTVKRQIYAWDLPYVSSANCINLYYINFYYAMLE